MNIVGGVGNNVADGSQNVVFGFGATAVGGNNVVLGAGATAEKRRDRHRPERYRLGPRGYRHRQRRNGRRR
ncbi:MAG: hypothetical protein M5U09_08560 [Gammaproteobacteria bacterium]|nr:hypothetical protein [Gammaproteobacteria bacterium]